MSAAHQLKKVRQSLQYAGFWEKPKRRTVDGVVYATQKDARIARARLRSPAGQGAISIRKLERRLAMKKKKATNVEVPHGWEEADRAAA